MKNIQNLVALSLCAVVVTWSAPAQAQFNLGGFLEKAKKITEVAKDVAEANKEFSEEEEAEIGDVASASILGGLPPHPDANLQRYVNRVGLWVAVQSSRPNLNWSFTVLDTQLINAFAAPGGSIFVSAGLIKRMRSEAELASVLGHEIGHVVQKHHLNATRAEAKSRALKGIGGAILEHSKGSALGKEALGKLGNITVSVMGKSLDKSDEYEADRIGIILAARAGYDAYGLVSVLQKLATVSQADSGLSLMMSTHPTAADRIEEIEKFAGVLDRFSTQPQVESRFQRATASLK